MANTTLVASSNANDSATALNFTSDKTNSTFTDQPRFAASSTSKIYPTDVSPLWGPFENKGLSRQALSFIMSSWRQSTQQQYVSYI
ncbi:Hypothetical predicted protein, partial [Paramuricea clavata]